MRTEVQCVHCLIQMLWKILLRMKKMEVGVLLEAVPKLVVEAPHQEQEAPPPSMGPKLFWMSKSFSSSTNHFGRVQIIKIV